MAKLTLLENCFSDIIRFSSSEQNVNTLCYDPLEHVFKPQVASTQLRKRDFISELKFCLEDVSNFPKSTIKLLHHLIGELTLDESRKVYVKLSKVIESLKSLHGQVLSYIEKHELPGVIKQEIIYHTNQMNHLIHDCQILVVQVSTNEGGDFFGTDLTSKLKVGDLISPEISEQILKKIISEVDQMIRRLPFIVPEEERSRIIGARFKEQIEKFQ